MNKKGLLTRAGIGATGAMLLMGGAGVAVADVATDEVEVNVEIQDLGALTMSVAADSTTLSEVDSDLDDTRRFDGTLPTVTVSDTRQSVPEGAFWYVTGQSSAFTADGAAALGPEHLGWTPNLLTEGGGEVAEGPEVPTVLDEPTTSEDVPPNNVGLAGEELLALTWDAAEAQEGGEWEANADLFLKTPADVAPGAYSATITLTLWEDAF